jgi:hypothetical protein
MSAVTHAPGPWGASFSFPGRDGIGDVWQIDADGHAVCTTQFCYAPHTEANARLIAAAPDLLEAGQALQFARKAQKLAPSAENLSRVRVASDAFDEAIAKATAGETRNAEGRCDG